MGWPMARCESFFGDKGTRTGFEVEGIDPRAAERGSGSFPPAWRRPPRIRTQGRRLHRHLALPVRDHRRRDARTGRGRTPPAQGGGLDLLVDVPRRPTLRVGHFFLAPR